MTLRDIVKNILQYLSVIIINILAVTLFCGFVSNSLTLEKNLKSYYEDSNLTDIICQYSTVSADDMNFIKKLDVDEAEYRLYSEGSINQKSAKIYINNPNNKISLPQITEGVRGVLVDRHTAEMPSFNIGSEIKIELPPPLEYINVKITGIMNFAESANTYTYCPVYLDFDVLTAALPDGFKAELVNVANQILIKTTSPKLIKEAINNYYADDSENTNFVFAYDRDSMESVVLLNSEISQSFKMIYVFPVIFLLVSVLVILSTIGPLILRERTNIGTLKGLGISNKRLLLHYSLFGAVLCLIGGIIGIIIAPFIVPNVMLIKYSLVYSIPKFAGIVFSPLWSAAAVLFVCALAFLIGFLICYKTILEKPANCMRPLPPKDNFLLKKTVKNTGENTDKKNSKNIPLKMAVRNILVKPGRALMTIAGVTGCVALLVCSFGIGDTVNNSVELELGKQFNYDITTTYTQEGEDDFKEKLELLRENGEITDYETYKTYYMSARGKTIKDIKIFVFQQNSKFTTIHPNGKVLITKSIAEDLKINKGDTVILSTGGYSYDLKIDEFIETSYSKGIFLDNGAIFESNKNYLSGIYIAAKNPGNALVNYINTINGTGGAVSMADKRDTVNNSISSISLIRFTLMIFAIMLSVVVLYNLSLLNIKERSRDIATMKVLGFTGRQIGRSLLYEIMFLVLLGTVFGLLLGYPITFLVLSINKVEVLTFIYRIKPLSYLISAAISLVTGFLINFLFSHRIKEINMIESLKSVE